MKNYTPLYVLVIMLCCPTMFFIVFQYLLNPAGSFSMHILLSAVVGFLALVSTISISVVLPDEIRSQGKISNLPLSQFLKCLAVSTGIFISMFFLYFLAG